MLITSSYTDPYVSMTPGMGAFFGNRSFVIHMPDKTRIACGNFLPADQAFAGMAGMPPVMMPPPGMLPPGMVPAPPVVPGGNPGNANPGVIPGMPQVPGMPSIEVPPAAAQPTPAKGGKGGRGQGQRGQGGRGGQGQGGRGGQGGMGGGRGGGFPGGGGFGLDADVDSADVPAAAGTTALPNGAPKDQAAQFPGGNYPQQGQQGMPAIPVVPGAAAPAIEGVARQGSASRTMTFSMSALAALFLAATVAL
jgi:hypothetical protein